MPYARTLMAAGLLLSLTSINAEASLTPYTSGGQNLVYSSISNLTWTNDANLLSTLEASNPNLVDTIISIIGSITDTPNAYDTPANTGAHILSTADFGAYGLVNWFGAKAFTSYLNTINYAGSNQWQLPHAGDHPQVGYNLTDTQFGQLFFDELDISVGNHIPDTEYFINEQSYQYWMETEYSPAPNTAWDFDTNSGALYRDFKNG